MYMNGIRCLKFGLHIIQKSMPKINSSPFGKYHFICCISIMHQPFVTAAGHSRTGQRIARQMCRSFTFLLYIVPALCVWGGGEGGGYVIDQNDIAI